MAKKGQAIQLQIEINSDEEWEKLLQKEGLIVVDIYSDWCGPCLGMQANLKKLKLEIGGDMLQLAIAKSDNITALSRFRNKSEPTWMFLSKGKMVRLMFGADAPNLTRLIAEELKNEKLVMEGQTVPREEREVTDLAEEEQVRFDAEESIRIAAKEKEDAKKAKELLERRTEECKNILTNLVQFAVVMIFPNARDKYREVLSDLIDEAGLSIQQTEKLQFTEEELDEMCYFSNKSEEFSEESIQELLNEECLLLLIKPTPRSDVEDVNEAVLKLIYGEKMAPPGDPDCAAKKITELIEEARRGSHESDKQKQEQVKIVVPSAWVPLNELVRATILRIFFPKLSSQYYLPEPEPEPDHVAVVFDLHKKNEALEIAKQYPDEIMHYGFFTSEVPEEATIISRSNRKLEKAPNRTYQEKLVLQVTKRKSECVLAFAQLDPLYMSPNAKEGKRECGIFFPDEYDEGGREDEEEPEPEPEQEKKKKKRKRAAVEEGEQVEGVPPSEDQGEEEQGEEEGEEEGETEGEQAEVKSEGASARPSEDVVIEGEVPEGTSPEDVVVVEPPAEGEAPVEAVEPFPES